MYRWNFLVFQNLPQAGSCDRLTPTTDLATLVDTLDTLAGGLFHSPAGVTIPQAPLDSHPLQPASKCPQRHLA